MSNFFETGDSLRQYLESDESEDYRDSNFAYLFFDLDGGRQYAALNGELFLVPYWLETYKDRENVFCEYATGYYEPLSIGDEIEIDGEKYQYIDSQLLDEEIEHQADDGELVYEYRGPSFLRIWEKID